MRSWATCALTVMTLAGSARADSTDELIDYYGVRSNYRKVKRDVMGWHKTTRNGCVAFVSTAMRHVGIDVPLRAKRAGWGISRITFAFSDYLLEERGWEKVANVAALEPGDLVFTTGYPDHVMVFHSWKNKRRRVARVIDNTAFVHTRSMLTNPGDDRSPFGYALRAPAK